MRRTVCHDKFVPRADLHEGDGDNNFSVFRVRWFTEWPGSLHCIAFPVEILTKPSFTECLPPFHWKPFFFTEQCFVASPPKQSAPVSLSWQTLHCHDRVRGGKTDNRCHDNLASHSMSTLPDQNHEQCQPTVATLRGGGGVHAWNGYHLSFWCFFPMFYRIFRFKIGHFPFKT